MKTIKFFGLAAIAAVIGVSCQKEPADVTPDNQQTIKLTTLSCAFPAMTDESGTKVTLSASGTTAWEVNDQIVFQGCPRDAQDHSIAPIIHTFTSEELANPEVASFSVDLSSLRPDSDDEVLNHDYNAAYPASIWSSYSSSHMYGRSSFSNTNKMLMAGYVDGSSVVLHHVTAAIVFQVSGDYDGYLFEGKGGGDIVGYSKLVVETNKPNVTSYRKKYTTSTSGTNGPLNSISGNVASDGSATIFLPVNTKRSGSESPYTYEENNENGANYVHLPNGFTIYLTKGGEIKKYITSKAPLDIQPGHMINLGVLPAGKMHDYVAAERLNTIGVDVTTATDLSATATSNCYIVDGSNPDYAGASFKFKAAKGKGGAVLSNIGGDDDNDVVVLWSTKNTAVAPSANEIISAVDYDIQKGKDAYIVFKMPATIVPGNAVIAAKDSGGNILWSWHIWVPATAITYSTYGDKSSKLMMSRNLGALVDTPADGSAVNVTSFGLLYQWGRKDPFVGVQSVGSTSFAAVSGTAKTNNGGKMTIEQTIANPTVFGDTSDALRDWNSSPDNSLWGANGSNKSQYDPCPVGYRVPTRDLLQAFFNAVAWTPDMSNYYVKADDITAYGFPITNYLYEKYGNMYGYDDGPVTYLWASYRNDDATGTAYVMRIKNDGAMKITGQYKASGASVRCVAE